MAQKLNNLDVALELSVFSDAIGKDFDKIVSDVKSMLGRISDAEVAAKHGGWKAGVKGQLKSTEGYTVQLPLNNPASSLLMFGMKIRALAESGEIESIQATIPKYCRDWVHQHSIVKEDVKA